MTDFLSGITSTIPKKPVYSGSESLSPYIAAPSSALLDQNNSLEIANKELQKKIDAGQENVTGPSRTMSNVLAGGTLGLGVASFLDNRKTAKLQRSAMQENLQMARDAQAARKARTAGWANAFGGNE